MLALLAPFFFALGFSLGGLRSLTLNRSVFAAVAPPRGFRSLLPWASLLRRRELRELRPSLAIAAAATSRFGRKESARKACFARQPGAISHFQGGPNPHAHEIVAHSAVYVALCWRCGLHRTHYGGLQTVEISATVASVQATPCRMVVGYPPPPQARAFTRRACVEYVGQSVPSLSLWIDVTAPGNNGVVSALIAPILYALVAWSFSRTPKSPTVDMKAQ